MYARSSESVNKNKLTVIRYNKKIVLTLGGRAKGGEHVSKAIDIDLYRVPWDRYVQGDGRIFTTPGKPHTQAVNIDEFGHLL